MHQALREFFTNHKNLLKRRRAVLVACSGGRDSICLLDAVGKIAPSLALVVHVAHINHRLRGAASDKDEKLVERAALTRGLPFHRRAATISPGPGNLEEKARVARYNALAAIAEQSGCSVVLTAHHLNDQAETVLMNILRGSGSQGLKGMSSVRILKGDVWLGRPLLNVPRAEIEGYARFHKLKFRHDASNRDPVFIRNWLRTTIVPAVERRFPHFVRRLASIGQVVTSEEDFWTQQLEKAAAKVMIASRKGNEIDGRSFCRLHPALQRRLLRREIHGDLLSFEAVERVRKWMEAPPTSGRICQLRKGWVVERLSKTKGSPSAKRFWIRHEVPASRRKIEN